jgi:preprotein translocase subunit SecD
VRRLGLRVFPLALVLAFPSLAALAAPLSLDIAAASVGPAAGTNEPVLNLTLTLDSAKAFAAFTAANVGRTIELRIDGKVVMAPVVREPITGGLVQIAGSFRGPEIEDLVHRIVSGAAKVAVEVKAD